MAFTADVTKLADVESAVRETVAALGRLDIVVNNAGWTHRNKSLLEVTEAEFDRVFSVNIKSIYLMTNLVVPIMQRHGGGSIINIGSTAGARSTDQLRKRLLADLRDHRLGATFLAEVRQ